MSIRKKPVQEARRPSSSAASRIYSRENVSRYTERSRQRRRGRAIRRGILLGFCGVFIAAVAAAGSELGCEIEGAETAAISYPGFWEVLC